MIVVGEGPVPSRCPTQEGITRYTRRRYGLAAVGGHGTLPYKNDGGPSIVQDRFSTERP